MTYKSIMERVCNNLNIESISSKEIAKMKKDIYDVCAVFYRKLDAIKKELTRNINQTAELGFGEDTFGETFGGSFLDRYQLPSDFFAPIEVVFLSEDGRQFAAKEVSYESYMRWNPTITEITTSFAEMVVDATPQTYHYTEENEELDGLIGYCFTDDVPQLLLWKPAVSGTIKIYYSYFEVDPITDMNLSPRIHKLFEDVIVDGVTVKWIVRKLSQVKTEFEYAGLRTALSEHKESYKQGILDYGGYTNKRAETPIVKPFDFLNDSAMLL